MKSSELRIGNLVNTSKGIRSCIDVMCDSVSFEDIECDILDNIEPIPLTEEWLLKFGFGNCMGVFDICHNGNTIITFESLYNQFIIGRLDEGIEISIKYVHQLQNLYFALTGEELNEVDNNNV